MEPVKTQAVLITEMNSLRTATSSSIKEKEDNDEISKELEDQLLYDEEDALSDDSIRLRVSDDEADGENSGASDPVNSQLKKKNKAELLESSEDCPSVEIPLKNQPSVQNGVDTEKKVIEDNHNMIDFADDDISLDENFRDGHHNSIIFGEERKDKMPMFNQFPQSAYDDSWRLTGEMRNRLGNRFRISYHSRRNNRNFDYGRKNHSNKVYTNPYHKEMYWESKSTNPLPPNKYTPRSFPPSSKKKSEITHNLTENTQSDCNTSQDFNIEPANNGLDSMINNAKENSIMEESESLEEKSKSEGSEEPEKESVNASQAKIKENGIPNDDIFVNDKEPNDIDSNENKKEEEFREDVVNDSNTSMHDDEAEKNDESKEDSFVEVPIKIEAHSNNSEPMTEESSDSGIASIAASITPVDEISKDDNEEISGKIVEDDIEPPILEPMEVDVVESTTDTTIPISKSEVDIKVGESLEKTVEEVEPEIVKLDDVIEPIKVNDNHESKVSESKSVDEEIMNTKKSHTEESEKSKTVDNDDDDNDDDDDGIVEIAIDEPKSTEIKKIVIDLVDSTDVITEAVESTNNETEINANKNSITSEESKPQIVVDHPKEDEGMHDIVDIMDQSKSDKRGPGRPKRKRKSTRSEDASNSPVAEKENIRFREKRETAQKAEERIRKDLNRRKNADDSEESDVTNRLQTHKEKEYVRFREKRETAQKAEELIRKESARQKYSDESEDSDDTNHKSNIKANSRTKTASPVSLKRINDEDEILDSGRVKKPKKEPVNDCPTPERKLETVKLETKSSLGNLRNFLLRDAKKKLTKLTQEQLEELLIQKMIETITMGAEIGKLREDAKMKERETEISRAKCQQLSKQIKDFEMVLNRYAADRRITSETHVTPIKINRSVGLQVNFLGDHGIQNLRQVHNSKNSPKASPKPLANGLSSSAVQLDDSVNQGRRGLKVRSPRRSDGPVAPPLISNVQTPVKNQTHINTSMTTSIIVNKVVDTKSPAATTLQVSQSLPSNPPIVINGSVANQQNRQVKVINSQSNKTENLIDLTVEEEKTKISPNQPSVPALITPVTTSITVPKLQPRSYPRVISSTPANIPIPPTSLRVVQPSGQPTPTAIVNNVNTQRFLVMQPGAPPRQLLITSNANTVNQIGTAATANTRASFSGLTYTGVSTIPNGTALRVVPSTGTATIQMFKVTHPAPLPEVTIHQTMPGWKLPPPAPSLKISKVTHGIVLSWNMGLSDKYAEIASYQLYAYQEIPGLAPSSTLWKKVGDVRALPLPMACTLTQFSEGNNYYFAVRAVDRHSRLGQYSQPGNISL